MGAFKKINRQDVYLSKYEANKNYSVSGSDYELFGITTNTIREFREESYFLDQIDELEGSYAPLFYKSLDHLYYKSFNEEDLTVSTSYEHYVPTSLLEDNTRELDEDLTYISIPRSIIGNKLQVGSFKAILVDQIEMDSIEIRSGSVIDNSNLTQTEQENLTTGSIIDNSEGTLLFKHPDGTVLKVGNLIYNHGIIIITYQPLIDYLEIVDNPNLSWKSSVEVLTYNAHLKISDHEYNLTLNPTASDTEGNLLPNVTSSAFTPYISTVGLYNDANELLAVGKLNQPTPKSAETEMSIIYRINITSPDR